MMDLSTVDNYDLIKVWWQIDTTDTSNCWNWPGPVNLGSPILTYKKSYLFARRVAFYLTTGEQPPQVRDSCGNRLCINPKHLFAYNFNKASNKKEPILFEEFTFIEVWHFMQQVDLRYSRKGQEEYIYDHPCWSWKGSPDDNGYGTFRWRNKSPKAHRVSYWLFYKEQPDEAVNHLCSNRICVNPYHLQNGTNLENTLHENSQSFAAKNKRKTHCPKGHLYDAENTYTDTYSRRSCRECSKEYDRKRAKDKYAKEKATQTHTSEMRDFASQPKLDWDKVREIRKLHATEGWSQRTLARRFEISQPMVGMIVRNESWQEELLDQ